jgi:hypothetical protein
VADGAVLHVLHDSVTPTLAPVAGKPPVPAGYPAGGFSQPVLRVVPTTAAA